jgi:hypothetical protein
MPGGFFLAVLGGFLLGTCLISSDPVRGRRDAGVTHGWWKRPAIHMPRAASRILLDVTNERMERLQEISEADAIAPAASRGAASRASGRAAGT